MAKIYGSRWKTIEGNAQLGQGGQSQIFRVLDTTGEHQGEFALKRVLNPARHERFRTEVEAIKLLQHPNVIKLIDHSALTEIGVAEEKQFLVTPIAHDGDLSRTGRLNLYKDSIEAVLQVAKQIASGLLAAHKTRIIHRDIKPQNILFTGNGHEVWIADFGICLLREQSRITPEGEVVGPRAFMAPELEDGGHLDVTPAADIYSLGKVIYYMFSNGVVVPRERLHEAKYAGVFQSGERPRLLQLLLTEMICPLDRRLTSMEDVIKRLDTIEAWEQNARLLPIGAIGLAGIEKLQRQSQEAQRVIAENTTARGQEQQTQTNVCESFRAWVEVELKKTAIHISSGGSLNCEVGELTMADNENWAAARGPNKVYRSLIGLELRLEQASDAFPSRHILQIHLCRELGGASIRIHHGPGMTMPPVEPVRDLKFAMIPFYRKTLIHDHPKMSRMAGFISKKEAIGTIRGQISLPIGRGQRPTVQNMKIETITRSFHDNVSQCVTFNTSEWPAVSEILRNSLKETIDSFIAFIASGANVVGL